MFGDRSRTSSSAPYVESHSALIVVCSVAVLSYLVPLLEGKLIANPRTVWPLWPVCAILVAGLALVKNRVWPLLIAASFAGFIICDLQIGVPLRSVVWFILADTVQVLIAAGGLRYFFDGVPRLDSIGALAKYLLFAVVLGPFFAAFFSSNGIGLEYWSGWKVSFFSEVLAFVTLTPAIFSWVSRNRDNVRRSRAHYLEFALQFGGLVVFAFIAFTSSHHQSLPALLYALVPFLLWAALRLGPAGISTSIVVVTFLAIWGAVHGRGPFLQEGPASATSALQLFLVFAATPFLILTAVVEERRRAQQALHESNERFELAARAGKVYAYEWYVPTDEVVRTPEHIKILGLRESEPFTNTQFVEAIHPDDREVFEAAMSALTPESPTFQITYRFLRPSGGIAWLQASPRAFFDADGKLLRVVAMVADVTDRQLAEEARSSLSGRLIQAQEEERIRISRELHDDIGQRVALVSVVLDQLRQGLSEAPATVQEQMTDLHNELLQISSDLHAVSHELHSSTLDHVGLVRTARSWCLEIAQRKQIGVSFSSRDVPKSLTHEVSLCMFRILQEALHNACKHSGVNKIDVDLWGDSSAVHLKVSDSGNGFDVNAAVLNKGLGLTSMQERARLVKGQIQIVSRPMGGTTIYAHVPVLSEKVFQRAAS